MTGPALLDRVALGDHVCWIVDDDEVRRSTIAAFLIAGLRARQRVVYCGDDPQDVQDVLDALGESGADTAAQLRTGQLTAVTAEQTYLAGGFFDAEATLASWAAEIERARTGSYLGLRVVGDMNWAGRAIPGAERIGWYEAHINTVFTSGFVAGICAYDRRRFDPLLLRRLTWSHPGTVCSGVPFDPATALRFRRTPDGLRITGEADRSNRAALETVIGRVFAGNTDDGEVIVDLSGLRFADTAVARLLVHTAATGPGRLRLVGCNRTLLRLLAFTGAAGVPALIVEAER